MAELPKRLYNLAKSYVDLARTRIDEIDAAALAELQSALPDSPYSPSSSDPMERAAAKIGAARSAATLGTSPTLQPQVPYPPPTALQVQPDLQAQPDLQDQAALPIQTTAPSDEVQPTVFGEEPNAAPPVSTSGDPLSTAYRVIGLPSGTNLTTVEDSVRTLRERCDPNRFQDGTAEQQEARRIRARIDEAYALIQHSFNIESGRFDKLEL